MIQPKWDQLSRSTQRAVNAPSQLQEAYNAGRHAGYRQALYEADWLPVGHPDYVPPAEWIPPHLRPLGGIRGQSDPDIIFDPEGKDDTGGHMPDSREFQNARLPISTPDGRVWVLDNDGNYVPYKYPIRKW